MDEIEVNKKWNLSILMIFVDVGVWEVKKLRVVY